MADYATATAYNDGKKPSENVSGVKKVEFNFSEFKFEYMGDLNYWYKPYPIINNGSAETVVGQTKYQGVFNLAYDAKATISDFFNFSIKGVASADISSLMIALLDASANATPKPYKTNICSENGEEMITIATDIKKGETFDIKASWPIQIAVGHDDLRYQIVLMAESPYDGIEIILDLKDADMFEIGSDKGFGLLSTEFYFDNLRCTLDNNEIAISAKDRSLSGNLEIPSQVSVSILGKDYPVTSIGSFAYCEGLTSIIIPESVTNIEANAFSGCNNLTSVTINSNVDVSNAGLYFTKDGFR